MVETRGLSKRYRRNGPLALQSLNLQVSRGSLFGFVGPNGAGKTTTLRMLAGLLQPSEGEIIIAGQPVHQDPWAVRRYVGYMPDFFGVYQNMTAWEYLDFFARCHDLPLERRGRVVTELLELVNLAHKRDEDVGSLSRGMQQRLCLAQALVHDPAVLLLDEPASGLDPRARVEMRELLRELTALGKTIILSSHILSELAEMCDEVGIIEHGRIVASGPLASLQQRAQTGRVLRLHVLSDPTAAADALAGFPEVRNVAQLNGSRDETAESHGWLEAYLAGDAHSAADLLTHLVSNGVAVAEFRQVGNDLEELFLQLTTGEGSEK
ncbi:MAG: ABC transporter ATP-binding protein [Anaerolineales bacterium]|nr:ABC transporter ATP-binding protein [Anaerolineales bacterium]